MRHNTYSLRVKYSNIWIFRFRGGLGTVGLNPNGLIFINSLSYTPKNTHEGSAVRIQNEKCIMGYPIGVGSSEVGQSPKFILFYLLTGSPIHLWYPCVTTLFQSKRERESPIGIHCAEKAQHSSNFIKVLGTLIRFQS